MRGIKLFSGANEYSSRSRGWLFLVPSCVFNKFTFYVLACALSFFGSAVPAFAIDYPPTLLDPNVLTYQNSTPAISGASGALTQTVPLDLPPGRGGVVPNLSLDYNSQNTSQDSEFGYGWSLSIPYIQRLNKTGSQDLYGANPVFSSSLDGQLVSTTSQAVSGGSISYVIVGGGGGGGNSTSGYTGGGGGAGGQIATGSTTLSVNSYSVVVGSGGSPNSNGNNTTVFGFTANGGVAGVANNGSGGSTCSYVGGSGATDSGGGGASCAANGSNATSYRGGNGADGEVISITGTATYYGGGGGGGGYTYPATTGFGGQGGGGNGSIGGNGANGVANTGGGGGGAQKGSSGNPNTYGGSGGSGIVIISYPTADASDYTCGGTTTTSGSNTICTYTSNGTFTVLGNNVTAPLGLNLLGYWRFNESSGNASDATQNENALSNNGTAAFSTGYGILNQGASLNGSSQYFATSSASLAQSGSLSVSLWANFQSTTGTQYLISRQAGSGSGVNRNFFMYYSGGVLTGGYYDGTSLHEATTSWTPTVGAWYNLALSIDTTGGHVYEYVNGSQVASASTGGAPISGGSQMFAVGASYENPGYSNYFDGYLDEIGYWSRALSSTEVTDLYNSGGALDSSSFIAAPLTGYLARVDDGSLHQYTYATTTNSWTMFDKNGNEYFFGSSDQSKQFATSTPSNVFKWMLDRIQDPNGNFVRYEYAKDGNQIYPSEIYYTGHNATDGPMAISFATSTRPDTVTSFATGFKTDTNWRISQISAAINGTTVRQYDLGYAAGNNGSRSLLSSIQEHGWNSASVEVSAPPMTFSYESTTTPFVEQGTNYSGSAGGSCAGDPWVAADVSGDGINDLTTVQDNTGGGTTVAWVLSNGHSNANSITSPPAGTYWANEANTCLLEEGSRILDVKGDGKAEIVQNYGGSNVGLYANNYATSTGYAWAATTTYSGTIPVLAQASTPPLTTGLFGNLNGTGFPSYIRADGTSGAGAYFGNGSAWSTATTTIFVPPMNVPTGSSDCTGIQLVDVNGDGLDDWVSTDGTNTYVRLNTGSGWQSSPDTAFTIATSTLYSSGGQCYDRGMRFVDINGDGLPDFIRSYDVQYHLPEVATSKYVYLNTGNGWATSTVYTLPTIIDGTTSSGGVGDNELFNFKGNGQQNQDVLATIAYPKGGSTSVTYEYTTQSGTNSKLPYNLLVAKNVVNHNGQGSNEETDYSYSGAVQYLPTDVFDRKFAGFGSVTASTSQSTVTTYYSQGATSTALAAGDRSDGYGQIGYPYRKDILTPSGTKVQSTFYQYDPIWHGDSEFMSLVHKIEQDYAPDGSHVDKASSYTYSTTTDQVIQSIDYGEVTGNSDGTFSTTTASTPRTTTYTYATNGVIKLSVPAEKILLDAQNATTTDTRYFYDNLPLGEANLGNETKEDDWISGTHYASSTRAYNSFGLVTASSDGDGNQTFYSYDGYNLFPATTTNALSDTTTRTYNYSNGKTERSTNLNGGVALNSYDGLGRLIETDESDPSSPSSLLTKLTISYTDSTTTPSLVHETDYLNSASSSNTYDYFDGLNRLIQERKSTEASGTYDVTDRAYNTAGGLASKSLPYFSSGSSLTSATTTSALFTTYTYDPLNRITKSTNAVGSTTNAYAGWTTTTTDSNGNTKNYILDAFGNLAQVIEHLSSSAATTTYAYDAAGNLATTTDAAGNIRTYTYDGLGRRVQATDLHAAADATYGSWNYTFDDQGNETSRTDPNGTTITHAYDALNRMLTEAVSGDGTKVTNTYDSCTNGIGQLCAASSTGAVDSYAYDVLGRTTTATTTVTGNDYALAYAYDRQGNTTSVVVPGGSSFGYAFNGAGLVSALSRTIGATTSPIASLTNFAPTGAFGTIAFASGASTTYAYDAAALYRLMEIKTRGLATSTTPAAPTVNYLIVGGGGGGAGVPYGGYYGVGGGGGGQVLSGSTQLSAGDYTIIVGNGGAGGNANRGSDGYLSSAFSYSASGGIGGRDGAVIGYQCGGGISGSGNVGGAGDSGCGSVSNAGGGGGGGNGAVGGNGTSSAGGSGGSGTGSNITGSLVYYGGGGGGGGGTVGSGSGGGGNGGNNSGGPSVGSSGSGGGGGGAGASLITGAQGGSGVVVVSYPTTDAALYTCNGTATTTGSNTICTYDSSGTFTVSAATSTSGAFPANYLIIGGGGSGGSSASTLDTGGGGGGGGVLASSTTLAAGTYIVTVGAGGDAVSGNSAGNGGGNSSVFGFTAFGGGAGGGNGAAAANGGSGGGGAANSGSGSGTAGQGYAGGGGSNPYSGGGGGGAGATGSDASGVQGGDGGTGVSSSITGIATYYGGGGAGCSYGGASTHSGGSGGGGNGCNASTNPTDGVQNTGGGGGGGDAGSTSGASGAGGSGLVVISYPTADASNYTCNGALATSGSNTVCTYNWSGTFVVGSTTASSQPWSFTDGGNLQDTTYTYDANGNILTKTDSSDAGQGQEATYTYDALNRLTEAATTHNGSTPSYDQTFSYDKLGNQLSGPEGNYSYEGNTGTSYANPDAPTQIVLTTGASTPTIAYDNSTLAGNGTPASSLTFSHTDTNNTYGLILVSVAEATSSPCTSDAVTGVTDNGASLTDLGYYVRNSSIGALKTYYGFDPTQGTHNIVVSASASCILYATAASYTGVEQNSMPNASGTGNPLSDSGSVNPFQATTTPSGANAWSILVGVPSQAGTATSGPGTTLRQQQSGALYYADSNGPVSDSSGLSWSMPSATNWLANYFSISPYIASTGVTSSTTLAYDHNGNLIQKMIGATTTDYVYDYANRLVALRTTGDTATTTYAYDAAGSRVIQGNGIATTTYPNKFYSIVSSTSGATTTATSTLYAYDGSTLLATIDTPQTTVGATTTTATSTTHYVHADNLGSAQATSDQNGLLSQYFDYAPYGSVLASTSTDLTGAVSRQYIGQYTDTSGLSYLNARYYNAAQGQFLSQDPVFLGNPSQQNLKDPQSLNAYSYSEDNPITESDPTGEASTEAWLTNPWGTAAFVEGLGAMAAYTQFTGRPATAQLLLHAASLNPGNINAGNGSVYAQAISSSNLYKSNLQQLLWNATVAGQTSITNAKLPLYFTAGDAGTAFGHMDIYVNAQMGTDGAWQVASRGSDLYDFNLMNYNSPLVNTGNNFAYFGQLAGATSNFTTNVSFTQSVSLGYSSRQSSAIAGVAQAFGVTSLSSSQVSAIKAAQTAFSK